MFMMPFQVLGLWLRAVLSLAIIAGGITLLVLWYNNRQTPVVEWQTADGTWVTQDERPADAPENAERRTRWVSWQFGMNRETLFLLAGAALLLKSFGGRLAYLHLLRRSGKPPESPRGKTISVKRPDGTNIHVEMFGPAEGTPIVFIHGWSLNSDEWAYAKVELARDHRVIVWDLPGLGNSTAPADSDLSLEKMARDLDAVLEAVSFTPVVLAGHSIGGMIILTYCKLFPDKLPARVRALVVAQSTYTNPVKTTRFSGLMQALQKPVLEPMAYMMIWLSPMVRMLNWLSFVNGSAQRSTDQSSFSGFETRGQLDFLTKQVVVSDPAVVGRGFLAMFQYDATAVLPAIPVPVLVVAAEHDTTCLPEASEYMARLIPAARLIRLSDGRHCGVFEFHEEFHMAVTGFIASPPFVELGGKKEIQAVQLRSENS
jgi:pimeloyl-ACP methyl ester carboxylesterase